MQERYFSRLLLGSIICLLIEGVGEATLLESSKEKMNVVGIETPSMNFLRGPRGFKGPPGPVGPVGPTGATGAAGSLTSSFISYYSNELQLIPPSTSAFLAFTTPQTTNTTIIPTWSGSSPIDTVDTFIVALSGIYMITWNVAITTGNNVSATLDLLINGSAINSPFESMGYGGGGSITQAVSGSFLINLNASQIIQLQVSAFVGDVSVNSPSISIIRIADLP